MSRQPRALQAKLLQSNQDLERVDLQLKESEHARKEAEDRAQVLHEEALGYEQEITELQYKIRAAMPAPNDQEKS